jgi:magnesium chelatase family protein
LIAAMNPCPCGYLGDPLGECRCTPDQIARYRNRISGPLLDRIDMHVDVPRLPAKLLGRSRSATEDDSAAVRRRVEQARRTQLQRCGQINSRLVPQMQEVHCALDPDGRQLMEEAIRRLGISARAYDRILRIARSIADLNQSPRIEGAHLGEAIGFRRIDRRGVV